MIYTKFDALRVAEYVARRFEVPHTSNAPKVLEFFVFGSTVSAEKTHVNDLDLCALFEDTDDTDAIALPDFLGEIEKEMYINACMVRIPIDFIVLRHSVLWDRVWQQYYGRVFKNPRFIENVMQRLLLWNRKKGEFEWSCGDFLLQRYGPKV